MTKIRKEQQTEDERKLLAELQKNAKEHINIIANNCGFTRQKTWRLLKQMEKDHKIWGYTAIEDGTVNEQKQFILLVKRSVIPFDREMKREVIMEKLEDYIPNEIQIDDIFVTHGMYDGVVIFYAKNLLSAKKFIQEISRRIGKYFKEFVLIETLFPVQKQGMKNPQIKNLVDFI